MAPEAKFNLADVRAGKLRTVSDERGALVILEQGEQLEFAAQRLFFVHPAKVGEARGGHAHIACRQVLICISGRCTTLVDDGRDKQVFTMEGPDSALSVPTGIRTAQSYETRETVLAVLCDRVYEEEDYIRDYAEFLKYRGVT